MPAVSPSINRYGDAWDIAWPQHQVAFNFDRLHDGREGLHAMTIVESRRPESAGRLLGPSRLNLVSATSQNTFAASLEKRGTRGDVNKAIWHDMVVSSCAIVVTQYLRPSPTVYLDQLPDLGPIQYLVPGLVPVGETTFIYGDSESAKSLLALRIGLSVQSGVPLPWGKLPGQCCDVLVLDWETNERTVGWRLRRLCAGLDEPLEVPRVAYRGTLRSRQASPLRMLEDEIPHLREQVERDNIGLVIVDSIGFAVRGKLVDDDVARQAIGDLRMLSPATRLVVAHISKEQAGKAGGRVDPFGSAFFRAGLRSGFEVRRATEDERSHQISLGIFNWKNNDDVHVPPFGLRVDFDGAEGPIRMRPQDLQEVDELAVRTPASTRIRRYLAQAGASDLKVVARELDLPYGTVRKAVRRGEGETFIRIDDGGRGSAGVYGLRD